MHHDVHSSTYLQVSYICLVRYMNAVATGCKQMQPTVLFNILFSRRLQLYPVADHKILNKHLMYTQQRFQKRPQKLMTQMLTQKLLAVKLSQKMSSADWEAMLVLVPESLAPLHRHIGGQSGWTGKKTYQSLMKGNVLSAVAALVCMHCPRFTAYQSLWCCILALYLPVRHHVLEQGKEEKRQRCYLS